MLIKTYEFFIYYNKIVFREGLGNYIWSLIIPFLIFFSIKINWLFVKPTIQDAIPFYAAIWSYNIVSTYLYGLAGRIVIFRDNGFLRSFTYIAGSKDSIIFSLLLMQVFHGTIFTIIFTLLTATLFQLPVLYLVSLSILCFLISSIPISLFILLFAALPITPYTLNSIGSIVMLPALFITMFKENSFIGKWEGLFLISPVEYTAKLCEFIINLLNGNFSSDIVSLCIITILYIMIGLISWKLIKIHSLTTRT